MYSIGEVAEKTGISAHTLRYYDKEGLLSFVARSPSGIRQFKDVDFEWLAIISCLKSVGMPIKKIKEFISWCQTGDDTITTRLEMFKEQRRVVEAKIAEFQKYLAIINYKIDYYSKAEEAGTIAIYDQSEGENALQKLAFDNWGEDDKEEPVGEDSH